MSEQQENPIEKRIPTKGDLIEALRYASTKTTGEKNHVVDNVYARLETEFNFGEDVGWNDENILDFKLATQKLKLIVDKKIKQISPDSTKFIWVADGSEYDGRKLIN
ncbi:MAG: hypothetical protein WCV55_00270 [Candidatus Paceibacterota bacterium]